MQFENDVNPVTQDYLTDQIDRANNGDYDAVVIEMDTPGGLSESMRKIVKAELASKIPVIVYVSPDGSRAASAGVWIGQAADILAMAPQTNIGSSTPITLGGDEHPERPAPEGRQRRRRVARRARPRRTSGTRSGRRRPCASASNLPARRGAPRRT